MRFDKMKKFKTHEMLFIKRYFKHFASLNILIN